MKTNPTITDILYCGGDGSINYFINTADFKTIPQNIYLAQSGSGNDFLRSLKLIGNGSIAIGKAETNVKTTRFINGCGIGVDAAVCHYVNKDSKKNKLSYFKNAFKAMSEFEPFELSLTVDGVEHKFEKAFFCAVQNGKYFGGGMKIAPDADPTAPTFQVCVAHSISHFLISLLFMTIYSGLHIKFKKYVTMFSGQEITIKANKKCYFQADGEVIENIDSVHIAKAESRAFTAFSKPLVKSLFSNKI